MTLWLTVTAALASALMGGIFFAFSSFVMPALGRIPPAEGIRAMQRINIDVFHWSFVVAFFGTPAACLALAVLGAAALERCRRPLRHRWQCRVPGRLPTRNRRGKRSAQ